jgi:hypothetical protein
MKYLKTYESLYELPVILNLKDMALELTDMEWNIQIFKDQQFPYNQNENVRLIITGPQSSFFMINELKEFLFRAIDYMTDNDYEFETSHSNYGRLYFTNDDRIIISSGEARPNYPPFTMINILFEKKDIKIGAESLRIMSYK